MCMSVYVQYTFIIYLSVYTLPNLIIKLCPLHHQLFPRFCFVIKVERLNNYVPGCELSSLHDSQ